MIFHIAMTVLLLFADFFLLWQFIVGIRKKDDKLVALSTLGIQNVAMMLGVLLGVLIERI